MPRIPLSGRAPPLSPVGRADILRERAGRASEAGQSREAVQLYQRLVTVDPTNAEYRHLLGVAFADNGNLAKAIEEFENSLRIAPEQPLVWRNRGIALSRIGYTEEAIACFDRVIALQPDDLTGYSLRAEMLHFMGRFDEAIAAYDALLPSLPNAVLIAVNRGAALQCRGRFEEALAEYERAIRLDPTCAAAWQDKAILLMLLGDYPNGLPLFEWRWGVFPPEHKRPMPGPAWLDGSDIAGKTLFVYWEQGLGDTIHASRYVSVAARMGARVILEVQESLVDLMRTLDGVAQINAAGDTEPAYDLHCPIMSLPLAFGTTVNTIPADVPYLRAEPAAAARWRDQLASQSARRIGLVWAGGSRIGNAEVLSADQRRSLPLAALAPLTAVPNCTFVSLQVGKPAEEFTHAPAGMTLYEYSRSLENFADTAALIANLDLVISVDTSTAHLAGAMGKPVWLLNRFDTDWRWLLDREDSPWYPTMRIFRQPRPGDWASVIQSVAEALRSFGAR